MVRHGAGSNTAHSTSGKASRECGCLRECFLGTPVYRTDGGVECREALRWELATESAVLESEVFNGFCSRSLLLRVKS